MSPARLPRSLARRIVIAGATLSILTGIGLGGASAVLDFNRSADSADQNLDRLLYSAQPQLSHAYWQVDADAVRSILNRLAEEPLISSLVIRDLTLSDDDLRQAGLGDMGTASDAAMRPPSILQDMLPTELVETHRTLMLPNPRNGQPMAQLEVTVSYTTLYEALVRQAARIVVFSVMQALLIASMLYLLIRRQIIRPLSVLAQRVRARQNGQSAPRMPSAADEIGALADDVDRAFDEVERYRDRLQEEVDLRTSELVVARSRAEAASRAKTVFLANMSHELRTPLNAITGLSDLLLNSDLPAGVRDQVRDIHGAARLLMGGIDDVLDLSKLESGRMETRVAPFDLQQLIDEIALQTRALIGARVLHFDVRIAPGLPEWVMGDRQKLAQTLLNLTSNAVKFTPNGGIRLRVTQARGNVVFTVADTGSGITRADMSKIFEPFVQIDGSTTRAVTGTGLGLAIARQMAETMGGTLRARSIVKRGSVFCLNLPLEPVAAPSPAHTVTPQAGALNGRYVLLVEDRALNRSVVQALLARAGAHVICAESGRAALTMLSDPARERPDVILMDLHMPELDGFATLRALRQSIAEPIPVIASSADVSAESRAACEAAGFNGFLPKPLTYGPLVDMIGSVTANAFPVIDQQALSRMSGGSHSVQNAWLNMLPAEVRSWQKLLADARSPRARAQARHAILGGASQIGARDLARIAAMPNATPGRLEAALARLAGVIPAPAPVARVQDASLVDCLDALRQHDMHGIDLALGLAETLPAPAADALHHAAEKLDFDAIRRILGD